MLRTNPKVARADLLQADLAWFAMYLIKECIDTPANEICMEALLEEATGQLAYIRANHQQAGRRMARATHRGHTDHGGINAPVTSGQTSGI